MSTSARTCGRRLMAWVMALVLCLGLLPGAALAAEEPTYAKVTSADQFTTGTYYMVTDTGYAPGKLDESWISAVQVAEGTIPDAIWTLTVTGEEVTLKDSNGKFVAPKGGNNNGIKEGEYKWNWSFEDGKFTFAGQGDDTVVLASNKSSENKFRAYKTTTVSGRPNSYPSEFTLYKADDASQGGEVTVAAPQANPQAGAVASGTEITLSTTTSGASIYYTLNGNDPTGTASETEFLYSDASKPKIEGEVSAEVTLKAIAVLGENQSAVQTLNYTIQEDEPTTEAPIADGDQVVIYAPAYNKALSSKKTGFYNVGTDITVEADGTVTGYSASDIWTVVANDDGTYSFQQNGENIGLADSHASMDLGAVHDDWKLIDLGDGLYNVKNTSRGNYMEWYAQYSNWSTYNSNSAATDGQFQLSFYKVTGETPDPEPSEAPFKANDTIVIYAPSNNMALSATVKNDYYPTGVKVAVGGDTITGYSATEVWTVGGKDGSWTFSNGGKSLSMGNEHTSTYPGAGENETWVLEPAKTEGQYYVKNADRDNYLFWDDSYDDWTTRDNEKTAVTFVVVEPPEDEPDVTGLEVRATPASGASVKAGDTIELTAADGATIYYTTDGSEPTKESLEYTGPLTLGQGRVPAPTSGEPLVIKALAVLPASEGTKEQIGEVCTFTYQAPVTLDGYRLYFGQLHSHTNISDGAGTVEEAFTHASNVDNLDFLAVTDHSNSFDNESDASVDLGADLLSSETSSEWVQGHKAAKDATKDDFVGLYGFEMTWSDGFGHINTFNTPGFESRSNSEFGNKSGSTEGYQNYYDKLVAVEDSLSQFNHPGTTFGDFQDFAFYDPQVDQRITLIEVGNGEGAIGSSGYFPSYEYYTRALDKGWHVAPTNNQDNHKGNWGDSNTARSVVLASGLTEEGIYDAIRNYRVYATEDNDLSILYSLNGNAMGSILNKQDTVEITAKISDPTDSGDMKVEVIVNGGLVLDSQTLTDGKDTVTFTFDSNDYSYYYLRVTQADQNIAVTAPVWTGEGVNAGISKTECDTALVVKGEEVTLSSELYNNSGSAMTVQSVEFSVDGIEEPIYTANVSQIGTNGVISSGGSYTVNFPYAFTQAGKATVDVSMTATIGETEYTFAGVLQLTVTDESLVTRVLVDGTHWNDYVTGYYADRMGNFAQLAADMNAQVTIKQPGETITEADLEGVALLVISAPLKYDGKDDLPEGATQSTFSQEFINMVANYAKNGGTVILCGLADYQDNNNGAPYCSTEQINPILEAMGSTLRLNDDEVLDDDTSYNGGATQTYRVYMDGFNVEAFPELFEGIQEGQRYSAYSGCSVSLGENGVALVRGSANCYSINSNERPEGAKGQWDSGKPEGSTASGSYDAETAVVQKGDVVTLATETVGEGRVYVAGTVFLSNFEISDSASVDYGDASYANKTILENLLSGLLKEQTVSKIADVRANNTAGKVFTVEGTVTAGNIEPNAFYDTIYIQDATGGINIYPVATTDGTFRVGQQVQVTGSWDQYQGDTELRCISIEALGSELNPIKPTELDISDVDYANNGGLLAQVGGTVKSIVKEGDAISSVILTDGTKDFRLLFNNYIGYSDEASLDITTFVEEGAEISAVGVIYMDPDGVCLRVRDLSEVQLVEDKPSEPENPDVPEDPDVPVNPNPGYAVTVEEPAHGDVTVTPARAAKGDTVTITVTPDEGYQVEEVSITDRSGNPVEVTAGSGNQYTFTMPASPVEIQVTLAPVEEEPAPVGEEPFTDVDEGDWYYDAVQYVYEKGLMNGTAADEFAPNATTTRAMVVTILYRLEGEPSGGGETPFTDLKAGQYYLDAVAWANANGIVNGTTATTFDPDGAITRQQMAAILYRYAAYKGYDVSVSADLSSYPDAGAIQTYAQDAMAWANGSELILGFEDHTLQPVGNSTRAQVATLLMRFCEGVAK